MLFPLWVWTSSIRTVHFDSVDRRIDGLSRIMSIRGAQV